MPPPTPRNWSAPESRDDLARILSILRGGGRIEPGDPFPGDPVDLRGLSFPSARTLRKTGRGAGTAVEAFKARFADVTLVRADLSGASLSASEWTNAVFVETQFRGTRLDKARFLGCRFERCRFDDADLHAASFSRDGKGGETQIERTSFRDADLRRVEWKQAVLKGVDLTGAKLERAEFQQSLLEGVTLAGLVSEFRIIGSREEPDRNAPKIDASAARLFGLRVGRGVSLAGVTLPEDGSVAILSTGGLPLLKAASEKDFKEAEPVVKALEEQFGTPPPDAPPGGETRGQAVVTADWVKGLTRGVTREAALATVKRIARVMRDGIG